MPLHVQHIMEKALFLNFFKVSTDHLFDNLGSRKINYCFGKSLEFWIQISVGTLYYSLSSGLFSNSLQHWLGTLPECFWCILQVMKDE